jgi:hypothetical protein
MEKEFILGEQFVPDAPAFAALMLAGAANGNSKKPCFCAKKCVFLSYALRVRWKALL